MTLIAELVTLGWKCHNKKSNKYNNETKEYAYHVHMMELYAKILGLTLDSDKLREKYLK